MRSSRAPEWFVSVAIMYLLPWSLVAGCASPSAQLSVTPSPEREGTRGRSSYISAAELQSVEALTTLEAVRKLHPEFLRASPRASAAAEPTGPSVYVNRTYVGDISWLSTIPIVEIRDIAFLQPAEARIRFGATCQCAGGVVVVQTDGRTP